jgi:hypothetical protein
MKATINEHGTIVVAPENGAEAFALKTWLERNRVGQQDVVRGENHHWRGSSLLVKTEYAPPPEVFRAPPMLDETFKGSRGG